MQRMVVRQIRRTIDFNQNWLHIVSKINQKERMFVKKMYTVHERGSSQSKSPEKATNFLRKLSKRVNSCQKTMARLSIFVKRNILFCKGITVRKKIDQEKNILSGTSLVNYNM